MEMLDDKTKAALWASKTAMERVLEYLPVEDECGDPDCPDCMPWRPMREAVKMVNKVLGVK